MSTKITAIFDLLNTRIQTILPTATKMSNPYDYQANAHGTLENGFGIRMGTARNMNDQVSQLIGLERTVTVCLTRQLLSTMIDDVPKDDIIKTLLEDQFSVIKDFETTPGIDDLIANMSYSSDSGIGSIESNKFHILRIESQFTMKYYEDLN